jgi:hypothetical protein
VVVQARGRLGFSTFTSRQLIVAECRQPPADLRMTARFRPSPRNARVPRGAIANSAQRRVYRLGRVRLLIAVAHERQR